ncbi:MAG: hypothetical protein WAN50_03685 [Minisyncoccia bacterium]
MKFLLPKFAYHHWLGNQGLTSYRWGQLEDPDVEVIVFPDGRVYLPAGDFKQAYDLQQVGPGVYRLPAPVPYHWAGEEADLVCFGWGDGDPDQELVVCPDGRGVYMAAGDSGQAYALRRGQMGREDFPIGTRVRYPDFGEGTVVSHGPSWSVSVQFDTDHPASLRAFQPRRLEKIVP